MPRGSAGTSFIFRVDSAILSRLASLERRALSHLTSSPPNTIAARKAADEIEEFVASNKAALEAIVGEVLGERDSLDLGRRWRRRSRSISISRAASESAASAAESATSSGGDGVAQGLIDRNSLDQHQNQNQKEGRAGVKVQAAGRGHQAPRRKWDGSSKSGSNSLTGYASASASGSASSPQVDPRFHENKKDGGVMRDGGRRAPRGHTATAGAAAGAAGADPPRATGKRSSTTTAPVVNANANSNNKHKRRVGFLQDEHGYRPGRHRDSSDSSSTGSTTTGSGGTSSSSSSSSSPSSQSPSRGRRRGGDPSDSWNSSAESRRRQRQRRRREVKRRSSSGERGGRDRTVLPTARRGRKKAREPQALSVLLDTNPELSRALTRGRRDDAGATTRAKRALTVARCVRDMCVDADKRAEREAFLARAQGHARIVVAARIGASRTLRERGIDLDALEAAGLDPSDALKVTGRQLHAMGLIGSAKIGSTSAKKVSVAAGSGRTRPASARVGATRGTMSSATDDNSRHLIAGMDARLASLQGHAADKSLVALVQMLPRLKELSRNDTTNASDGAQCTEQKQQHRPAANKNDSVSGAPPPPPHHQEVDALIPLADMIEIAEAWLSKAAPGTRQPRATTGRPDSAISASSTPTSKAGAETRRRMWAPLPGSLGTTGRAPQRRTHQRPSTAHGRMTNVSSSPTTPMGSSSQGEGAGKNPTPRWE